MTTKLGYLLPEIRYTVDELASVSQIVTLKRVRDRILCGDPSRKLVSAWSGELEGHAATSVDASCRAEIKPLANIEVKTELVMIMF